MECVLKTEMAVDAVGASTSSVLVAREMEAVPRAPSPTANVIGIDDVAVLLVGSTVLHFIPQSTSSGTGAPAPNLIRRRLEQKEPVIFTSEGVNVKE